MLGRSANGVFWMCRYLERTENTARLIEAGFRMALTRGGADARDEWRSVIITAGQQPGYEARHADYTGSQVFNYMQLIARSMGLPYEDEYKAWKKAGPDAARAIDEARLQKVGIQFFDRAMLPELLKKTPR